MRRYIGLGKFKQFDSCVTEGSAFGKDVVKVFNDVKILAGSSATPTVGVN